MLFFNLNGKWQSAVGGDGNGSVDLVIYMIEEDGDVEDWSQFI